MLHWFCRIEMAVVAGCLLLVSLVVAPAILVARDGSREQICQDRLRHLGTAFIQYESAHGGLPPRRCGFNDGNPYGGWGGHLIPYLGLTDLPAQYDLRYDFFDPKNKAVVETLLPAFLCPSSPADRFVQIQSQASTKSLNPDKDTVFTCRASAVDFITSNGVLLTGNGYGINAMGPDRGVGNERQCMTDNQTLPLSKITDGTGRQTVSLEKQ